MAPSIARRGAVSLLCLALCFAVVVMCSLHGSVQAVDSSLCQSALSLQKDPSIIAFKKCAGVSPISPQCCVRMLPFLPYADCLQAPQYKALADGFLAPQVTVDRALRECLGS